MGRSYDAIPVDLQEWALEQQVFFVASAPLTGRHVNLSPKGLPSTTLTIFDPNHVGYVDATGSGVETISHVYENGRATIMFCSFGKGPKIMRWFCKGKVIEWNDPDFGKWVGRMGKKGIVGARAIIVLNVWKVQTSCGFGVPILSSTLDSENGTRAYLKDRETLGHFAGVQVQKGRLYAYQQNMNTRSLDGCAGLRAARKANGENLLFQDALIWLRRTMGQWEAMLLGALIAVTVLTALKTTLHTLGFHVQMLA